MSTGQKVGYDSSFDVTPRIAKAFGTTYSRTLAERFSDVLNVKDFGATGDGTTDDTSAIQECIDAANTRGASVGGCSVYFPAGTYLVTSSLLTPAKAYLLTGDGHVSKITGNFADYIIRRASEVGTPEGPITIERLHINNSNLDATAAGCVRPGPGVMVTMRDLRLTGVNGIDVPDSVFTATIENCRIVASQQPTSGTSIGIHGGACNIVKCDITGFNEGLRVYGANLSMSGCRLEVNGIGLRTARDRDGNNKGFARASITGITMEANDTAMYLESITSTFIAGIGFQGSTNSPSHQSLYGIRLFSPNSCQLSSILATGSFSESCIELNGAMTSVAFNNVQATNTGTWTRWDVRSQITNVSFEGCNFEPSGAAQTEVKRLNSKTSTVGLSAVDFVAGNKASRNMRGKGVVVTTGSTFVDVLFPPTTWTGATAAINAATPTAGGGLADGTYYYVSSLVAESGETNVFGEKTVVLGGGNNSTTLTFFGLAAGTSKWRRRIYRGVAPGVYDGYYNHPTLNSSASFLDTGAAFDGFKSVVTDTSSLPGGPETDNDYAIMAAPAWNTAYWISNKATTGFRINFATAPGSDSSVDWFLVR